MSKSRDKGTAAETMVVRYLQTAGWPHAERRALSGQLDKGDITGTPGLVWEVKSANTLTVPAWLRETESERINAKADYATLVIKPAGIGKLNVDLFYALMDKEQFDNLISSIADPPWINTGSRFGQWFVFETTVRKMSIGVAAEILRTRGPLRPFGWARYKDFVLTSLGTMADLLVLAGYGSRDD